jgi:hypothetical protein
MKASVVLVDRSQGPAGWGICFGVETPHGSFSFKISEPWRASLREWRGLLRGDKHLCLDQEGDDVARISSNGAVMRFGSSSGDVTARYTIPRALVADKLSSVLSEAERLGYLEP